MLADNKFRPSLDGPSNSEKEDSDTDYGIQSTPNTAEKETDGEKGDKTNADMPTVDYSTATKDARKSLNLMVAETFLQLDVDNDNTISFEEFIHGMNENPDIERVCRIAMVSTDVRCRSRSYLPSLLP